MKKLTKLSLVLAFVCTLFASACSDIDVTPRGGGEDEDPIIIVQPPKSSSQSSDSTAVLGG